MGIADLRLSGFLLVLALLTVAVTICFHVEPGSRPH